MRSAGVFKLFAPDFLKLSEVFPGPEFGTRVRELKAWLVAKGIRDFEAVPLYCDSVMKVRWWLSLVPVQLFNIWG